MEMWCVCLQEEYDKDDQGKIKKNERGEELKVFKCRAVVGTSPWKIGDIVNDHCKKSEKFGECVRLKKFIEYTQAANTLNVKQKNE